jgi:PilZ domain
VVLMTHYPQCNPTHRATRIKLQTTPALIKLGDGHKAKGRLQVISATGGLLQLPTPISEGDFVEVAFQTHSGGINGMAEMLNPLRSTQGSVFQPFRFIALDDDDHQHLRMMVESVGDSTFAGLRSSEWGSH